MKKKSLSKVIAGFIIVLFVLMNIVSSNAVRVEKEQSLTFDGNILYVGGSGPNNYTAIQSAIDDAINGDTVFVYDDSSPYREVILLNKSFWYCWYWLISIRSVCAKDENEVKEMMRKLRLTIPTINRHLFFIIILLL